MLRIFLRTVFRWLRRHASRQGLVDARGGVHSTRSSSTASTRARPRPPGPSSTACRRRPMPTSRRSSRGCTAALWGPAPRRRRGDRARRRPAAPRRVGGGRGAAADPVARRLPLGYPRGAGWQLHESDARRAEHGARRREWAFAPPTLNAVACVVKDQCWRQLVRFGKNLRFSESIRPDRQEMAGS